MKDYEGLKIIGIDNGYGNIKTANCCFPAGLTAHDTEPVFKDELLVYGGRYYLIGTGHKEFTADKTGDDDYSTMRNYFRTAERAHQHLTGYIVFSPASFTKEYSVESRTYAVFSDNKAFQPNMGGYSIYASSLDGSDPCVRLEQYMAAEYGGKDGWQIERCYMMSDEVERAKALTRTEKEHER